MPNTKTVRALISAFNVYNYGRNTVETNFTLQSRGGKDYIVVSFDKGMKDYQCSEYLYGIKRKIVREFYGIEEGDTDEVVLNTAKLIFDVESFPFNNYKGSWSVGKHGRFEFVAPIDKGVIFNLKSHLASSLVKDVLEGMPTCSIVTNSFNKGKYLCHSEFPNKELRKQFEREFLSRLENRYENVPKNPLKVEGNSVYIKDVFDDARFIDSVTRYVTWLEGMYLGVDSRTNHRVKLFKDMIVESIGQSTGVTIYDFVCASPLDRKEASILLPLVLDGGRKRTLTNEEALELNCAFNYAVFNDLYGRTQGELSVDGRNGVYGIDFSNPYISHCVITKIIESSVINAKHELSIDPELRFRALSPAQSPFNSPTHAGPSGLRTPPNQGDRDSGYDSNSPPKKPEDYVAHSPSGGPSSYLTESLSPTQEFPTRNQGRALKGSPRRGFIGAHSGSVSVDQVDVPGTSKGFSPRSHLGYSTVSRGVSGLSSSFQSVGAAQNVPAGSSARAQQPNRWSSPAPSAEPSLWQPSRPSSWRGANPVGDNPWFQRTNPWLSHGNKWQSLQCTEPGLSGLSSRGANESGSAWASQPIDYWLSQSSNVKEDCKKIYEDFEEAYEKIESDSSLSKEKEELFKALLYWFNLNNFIMECPHTNFIVENGKIASLINDGVNVKEYLQAVRDYTIKEYYVTEKEACDLNEFPFKFLSSCEKNQETTVVANISRGALFNLKKLFIQEQKPKKKVKIEDINIDIVETAEKSKRKEWVDSQVREHGFPLKAAIESCYPDGSVLKHISIIKDKGGYQIDHAYDSSEVKSLKKQLCTKGKSKAEKMKSEDNKDSGYSSGFVTDAENVSSKAEATTSGYESMDCENTRGGSPKRKSPSPEDGGNPRKSPKRDSLPLSRLESLSLSSSSHQIGKC